MLGKFVDKVALVTGAASGIGRATALAFAKEGASLALADLDEKKGNETKSQVESLGAKAIFVKTDIACASQVQALIDKTIEKFGRLDCAHNNAGVEGQRVPSAELSEADFDRVINTNLKGTWLCMKYEIKKMLEQGSGSIVNTASIAACVGLGGLAAYTASKHGIVGLTKAAALEYAKKNIRINAVCPGPIKTPMIENVLKMAPQLEEAILALEPMGRMGEPEEVATAILFLSSQEASFVTGHALVIDGGWIAQ
ncbi:MAG: SDR family oxidoreductase [Candidatus Obscuribacterales bacterium]|nr:SDR family oxidoreductase [Candidatus Obscuribacterales bacterium]